MNPEPSNSGARTSALAPAGGSWRSRGAWLTLLVALTLSIGVDLASKYWAFGTVAGFPVRVERQEVLAVSREDPRLVNTLIPQHAPRVVIPHLLEFTLVLNPGAVFGIGPGKRYFFVGFTVLALVFGLGMFAAWTTPKDRSAHAAIGLLLGGGLGNLYDRLVYGCVRDFLHPLPGWMWPGGWRPFGGTGEIWPYVSNVADLLLLIGIVMLMVYLWKRDRQQNPARPDKPAA